MTAAELIEELSKFPAHHEVMMSVDGCLSCIGDIQAESNVAGLGMVVKIIQDGDDD